MGFDLSYPRQNRKDNSENVLIKGKMESSFPLKEQMQSQPCCRLTLPNHIQEWKKVVNQTWARERAWMGLNSTTTLTGDSAAEVLSELGQRTAAASSKLSLLGSLQANPLQKEIVRTKDPVALPGIRSPALLHFLKNTQASASLLRRHLQSTSA